MKAKISIGLHKETQQPRHVLEVKNGLESNCICFGCGEQLVAVNNTGDIEKKKQVPHFRHHQESNCKGAPETALHKLSKRIIAEGYSIPISKGIIFEYSSARVEERMGDFQPDITLESKAGAVWLIEIAVTNPMNEFKKNKINEANQNCLEIDLQKIARDISVDDLRKLLLETDQSRRIIYRSDAKGQIMNSNGGASDSSSNHVCWIITGILAFILGRAILRRWRRKR